MNDLEAKIQKALALTDKEIFEKLISWATTFGVDVYGGEREEGETRRGYFRKSRVPGEDWRLEIVIQADLPTEEKIDVLAHEIGHLALDLLGVKPYQKPTHEPTASILGKCLIAAIREDYTNPLFKIGGVFELVKEFLELLKGKIDRTSRNLAQMEVAYLRWKEEVEGKEKVEG